MRKLILVPLVAVALFGAHLAADVSLDAQAVDEFCSAPADNVLTQFVSVENAAACGGSGGYHLFYCHDGHMDGIWFDPWYMRGGTTHFTAWHC